MPANRYNPGWISMNGTVHDRDDQRERLRRQRGMTMVEVMIAAGIFVVAAGGVVMLTAAMERQDRLIREFEQAESTARRVIEDIQYRGLDNFFQLYAQYDTDPDNDPDGSGTSPGPTFSDLTVLGLQAADDSPTGQLIEIVMHTDETEVNAVHGLPRDLNNDGDADDVDVSGDYGIIPFTVRIHWNNQGTSAVTQMETLVTRQ